MGNNVKTATYNEKIAAYGKALQEYRRGMITYEEMLAKASKAEKEYKKP